jgi:hypothetical protein
LAVAAEEAKKLETMTKTKVEMAPPAPLPLASAFATFVVPKVFFAPLLVQNRYWWART